MSSSSRLTTGIIRIAVAAVALLLVVVTAVVLFFGFVPAGSQLAGRMLSNFLSTPERQIAINGTRGLLTGNLHIDEVALSDTEGVYARAQNILVDWSPLSLLTGTFRADNIKLDQLSIARAPLAVEPPVTQTSSGSSSGFSLPVAVVINSFQLPDIELGANLTGRPFQLSAEGSADATDERVALQLSARRKDAPNAIAKTDLVFAPNQNELKLQALVSEPQGGLLARLLHLPGAPSVALAMDGRGPLSNWTGALRGTVAGKPVISVDGGHQLTPEGAHSIHIEGGGQLAELLPPAIKPLFAERTDIMVTANVADSGRIEIKNGTLTNGAMKLSAAGAVDPSGDNSLTGSLAAANGPVEIQWPLGGAPARISLDKLNFTLTGPAEASRFNATAALSTLSASGATFRQVRLQAESEDLNMVTTAGSIRTRLTAATADFDEPNLDRLIDGPIRLDAPIRLEMPAIGLDAATFESANISGTVSGAFNQSKQTLMGNVRVSLNPNGLPEAAGRYFSDTIGLEGYVDSVIGGRMSLENVVLKSSLIDGHGNIIFDKGRLDGELAGRLADIGRLRKDAKGPVGYDMSFSGPPEALALKAVLNAAELRLSGHLLQAVTTDITGATGPEGLSGNVALAGSIDGKPLRLQTAINQKDGRITLPDLDLNVGENQVSGALSLSDNYLPAGELNFQLPDIALLATLAGQQASGDLQGTVSLANDGGVLASKITATGQALTAQGVTLRAPAIDLASANVMNLQAQGTVKADTFSIGNQTLSGLTLGLTQEANRTSFDLSAAYSNAPLVLAGTLDRNPDASDMALTIERFSAVPQGVPVELTEPARIAISGNTLQFNAIRLTAGGGQIVMEGGSGDQLNLAIRINALPATIANSFVPQLAAGGAIGGVVTVQGTLASPSLRYGLNWDAAAIAQTRSLGLAPATITARGRFEAGTVTVESAGVDVEDQVSATANGTITLAEPGRLDLTVDLSKLSAGLANALRPDLAAEGDVRGTAQVTGSFAAPQARFSLALTNASIAPTRDAEIGPLSATLEGGFADNAIAVDALRISGANGISAEAAGTVSLAGERQLRMEARINALPAALIDIAKADLGAQGVLSGQALVEGTLSRPQAGFTLNWADGSLAQTRAAGLTGLSAEIQGRFAEQTVTLDRGSLTGPQGLSLTASGSAGLAAGAPLAISAEFAQLPASLANVARPDLDARGLLRGSINATGTLAAPSVGYDVQLADGSTAQTRQAGASAIEARMRGSFADGLVTLEETRLTDPSGLSVTATGNIRLRQDQAPLVNVNASIAALPANLANAFVPDLQAGGMISGTVSSSGTPDAPVTQFDLTWRDAKLRQTLSAGLAGLEVQAKGSLDNAVLTLQQASLSGPSGLSAKAQGTIGMAENRALNLTAELSSVPADLANSFLPGIEAGGMISGTASVSGTLSAPAAEYDLRWSQGVIRRQGDSGIGGLNLKTAGRFENGRLTLRDTALTGPEGLSVTAAGSVSFAGDVPQLDLNADINALPARLADAFQPGLGATGTISGRISSLQGSGPGGAFDLTWSGASVAQTRTAGLAPFNIVAEGSVTPQRLQVETRLSGASGLSVTGGGTVGLAGGFPLDLRVQGNLPFALAAAPLASQGFLLQGNGNVNVAIGGTASAPAVTGTATTSGARLIDVRRNLALNNLTANITFNRDTATLSAASAAISTGGRVSVQGTIGLRDGYAADLRIALDNAVYVDGDLVTAKVNGGLTVSGPLLGGLTIGGAVTLVRADITVPATLPSSLAEIDVKHVNAPADVRALLQTLGPQGGGDGTSTGINLDLTLNAPNGIFVRGRGIDAELGGALTIRGNTTAPIVIGAFDLRRGRIVILTKRLDFTEGRITFGGSLVPVIDFTATTSSGQTTITVNVTGQANNPDISFGSSPALPQDEILAQLIFGQSLSRLSALQIAQLADAVSQLAGGGDTSLLQSLRASLGIDDLDIQTDESGQTSVSIGRRLNNRTYLQLEQGGSDGGTRATINLDIGRGLKLKGSAGTEGGSAGIFYEKEY